ncbi:helix-turn-helix domain-containing protein [Thiothrix lacustris]|uniref:helix-turn-helix domain-containing protein n=1 Tax=Thiothrix lacustris TaxID=525917 RepID=UPI00048D0605|nr:transcriptional regulator [Thiothrix lacustris]
MTFGDRLREERERLGATQPVLAEMAGTTKKSQIDYEKNSAQPKSGYLAAIAQAGADVQYILTGVRSASTLAADERLLLERYRAAAPAGKDAILGAAIGREQAARVVIHGEVGQSFGDAATIGDVSFTMGGKKKPKG